MVRSNKLFYNTCAEDRKYTTYLMRQNQIGYQPSLFGEKQGVVLNTANLLTNFKFN